METHPAGQSFAFSNLASHRFRFHNNSFAPNVDFFPSKIFRDSTNRKKNVVFADGIVPGEGTSASESSSDGDEFSTKRAIARSKNKKRNARAISNSISANDINIAIDKENADEKNVNVIKRHRNSPFRLTLLLFSIFFAVGTKIRCHWSN